MTPALLRPAALGAIVRTYGAAGLARRLGHEGRARLGWYRERPSRPVIPAGFEERVRPALRVNQQLLAASLDPAVALARAERVVAGEYEAFRWQWLPLPRGADWHRHPDTGRSLDATRPWWHVPLLDPDVGDIKQIWEPARFGWVYDLIRGQALTGDHRFARAFLDRLDDFIQANPPFRGPQWACGQETAIRAIALLYAEANLAGCAGLPRLLELLAASGERIADAIGYALSQRNNHALSEAVGLLAIGDRLTGRHPHAGRWQRRGLELLHRLVLEQFAEDGWYCQHSMSYLRLALDQCVVAMRVLGARGESLGEAQRARLRAALDLLDAVIEPTTGIVPNHGPNDGALVHPISTAPFRDFRPVMTALAAMLGVSLADDLDRDRESLGWLGVAGPPPRPATRAGVRTGSSGWVVLRHRDYFVFMRAGAYRNRPGHFDPLHVDVRIGAQEVIVDPGTFRYGGPPPWRNALAGPRVHNGPVLDGAGDAAKGPRFLWLQWPDARIVGTEQRPDGATAAAEIPGTIRREIHVGAEGVEVIDRVMGSHPRRARVTWLLHPEADPACVVADGGETRAAEEGDSTGWFSPHYGERRRSRCVIVEKTVGEGSALRFTARRVAAG